MQRKINVLLADDHPAVRYGIKAIFEMEDAINICAEAESGDEVLEKVRKYPVDLVMMDVNMPTLNGIEATRILHKEYPDIKVLAFSMYDEQQNIINILKAGAHGYLLKAANRDEIMDAINTIMNGNRYITKELADKVLYSIVVDSASDAPDNDVEDPVLSKREEQILKLIAEDNSYKEIAEKLNISKRTVDTHRYNISKKLGIKSVAGLIRYVISNNL